MVHHVNRTEWIYPGMKRRIDKFDEELAKRLDETNFVADVGDDLYIDDLDEADEA